MSTRLHGFQLALVAAAAGCLADDSAERNAPRGSPAVWKDDLESDNRSAELAREYPIVFVSNRSGTGRLGLYLMSLDGGGNDAISVSAGEDHYHPRWSPTASSILSRRIVGGVSAELGLIAPDGSQLVLLTAGENPSAYAWAVNWSPDGERVSFGSIRSEGTHVWLVSRFGGSAERLLPNLGEEHREAVWSPDGARLAYSAQIGAGRRRDLFISDSANLDSAVNLTQGRVYAPGLLRWSPDGTRIAFMSAIVLPDGTPEPGAPSAEGPYIAPDDEIFVIDVQSTELTRITDNGVLDAAPAWSPDGTRLLFTSDRDGDADLWLSTLDPAEPPINLVDDADDPRDEAFGDWYWGTK